MGNIKKVRFQITGCKPSDEEAAKLSGLQVKFSMPGGAEFAEEFKWFFIGIICLVLFIPIGLWILGQFRGIGALLFGVGIPLAGVVMFLYGIYSLGLLLRSPHKKTVEKAAKWFWLTSCLGEDAASARFGKEEYGLSTMKRMFPEGAGFDDNEAREFIREFREKIGEAADRTTAETRGTDGWMQAAPLKDFKLVEDEEITPSLHRAFIRLKIRDLLHKSDNNGKSLNIETARIQLEIEQYYVRAGEAWFPYDLSPEIREITGKDALPDPDLEDDEKEEAEAQKQ